MPNNLTDKEIIKAWKRIYDLVINEKETQVISAPALKEMGAHIKATLDLINRLQVENENLKMVLDAVEDHINPLPFETDYAKAIRQAKAEAYKEYLEKFKSQLDNAYIQRAGKDYVDFIKAIADKTFNELVGDQNA